MGMNESLDVNSPKGQKTLIEERRAYEIFTHNFPDYLIATTPKELEADIDAVLIKVDTKSIVAIIETKCRQFNMQTLLNEFGNEWLITQAKVDKCQFLSRSLKVTTYGFLYLVPDDVLLAIRIVDNCGNILPKIRTAKTETQATVNGGTALRVNAYINMSDGILLKI
jgi:hypothetical protein